MMKCEQHKYIIWLIILILFSVLGCSREPKIYRSKDPVTIKGKYMGWACDDYTPQIAPIEKIDKSIDDDPQFYGFVFWILPDSNSPDMVDSICVPGNIFELKGYYYYTISKNKKKLSHRFDLLYWSVVAPYYRWKENGEKELMSDDIKSNRLNNQKFFSESEFLKAHKYTVNCK